MLQLLAITVYEKTDDRNAKQSDNTVNQLGWAGNHTRAVRHENNGPNCMM